LVVLAIATLAAVAMIPKLRAVFAPEELVPASEEDAARVEALLGPFGERDAPLLVLIRSEARDVLSLEALRFEHEVALHFAGAPWVERVASLTVTPFPHLVEIEADAATLETLDDDEEATLDPVLGRALATDPERFPAGFLSLAERLDGQRLVVAPMVEGELDDEERDAIEAWAMRTPAVRGALVSGDRGLAIIAIELDPALSSDAIEARVGEARAWLSSQRAPEGVRAELAGMPEVRVSMVDALRSDQLRLVLFAILGSLLVLAIGTRSWTGVLLPLASAGMTSAFVVGAMAALDEPLNLLNNTVAPLLITIGLGDAVHVIARYREELARHPDRFEAARRTMRAMGSACFLTAATTAVGFGSLIVSETAVVQRYAITAALGVLLGFVVTITFLPAALPGFPIAPEAPRGSAWLERGTARIASFSARRAVWVLVVACALLGLASWIGRGVRVDSTLSAQLDPSSPVRRTFDELEERLSGVRTLSIALHAPGGVLAERELARIVELESWLRTEEHVLRVDGPPELLGAIWGQLAGADAREEATADPRRAAALAELCDRDAPELARRYLRDGATRAHIEVRLEDAGEGGAALLLERIEARLATWDGVEAVVGGEAARTARGLDRLIGDLGGSVGIAMAIIFVMIGGMLRSVRLGLISILPNVMPLAITLAYMALRDIPLHAATMIVFSIAVGLAVADTIHLLARDREEIAAGSERLAAIHESLRSSGRAALLSAATLWIGYATLALASFVPIRLFGELSLVALGSAIVCEILILPALLATFGPVAAPAPEEAGESKLARARRQP
jgi:predicted RND superfamily exporter protein